ncbi:MAG TPA: hypothetical protein VI756_26645 [Blastocatellia bacterium]
MITKPHQKFAEICREELEAARQRIDERFGDLDTSPLDDRKDGSDGIRRFYEDLAEKRWTESDEECLASLKDSSQAEIKRMIRDAFRHSQVMPIPSLKYMIGLAKKMENEPPRSPVPSSPDAFSALEREQLANLLAERLQQTGDTLIQRLEIDDAKSSLVHEILQDAQGSIVSHFSPLV